MRALAFFVQLLFWLLVIRIVLRGVVSLFVRPRRTAPRAGAQPPRPLEDLVRDPVCHAHFPRSTGVSARIGGREELFCSEACRDRARAAVARAS
jgi:YHS domain-containing protein